MRSECLPSGKISIYKDFLSSIIICIPQPLSLLDISLLISLVGTLANKNGLKYRHSTNSPVGGTMRGLHLVFLTEKSRQFICTFSTFNYV